MTTNKFISTEAKLVAASHEFLAIQSRVLYPFDKKALQEFKCLHPIKTALDIGCGNGQHLKFYSEIFPEAHFTGIDVNPEIIKKAKEFLNDPNRFDIQNSSFSDFKTEKKFDAVFTTAVLQYNPDKLDDYFSLVKRILNPGGFVFLLEAESRYHFHYPEHPLLDKLWDVFHNHMGIAPKFSGCLPKYLEKYGFKNIEYKPFILNQYNMDKASYFELFHALAKVTQCFAPEFFTENDHTELKELLKDPNFTNGMMYNFSGAYIKGRIL